VPTQHGSGRDVLEPSTLRIAVTMAAPSILRMKVPRHATSLPYDALLKAAKDIGLRRFEAQSSLDMVKALQKAAVQRKRHVGVLTCETRLRALHMLSSGELCACELLESFHITQPTLSYSMSILCNSGLVSARRDGAWVNTL
jgi:DNA-binding transcriptional ArsR family regulator